MISSKDDRAAREVAAMQFAGGMSVARVAEMWERDGGWVEAAVREALLGFIPQRDGGLKAPREQEREMRSVEAFQARAMQGELSWDSEAA